MSLSSTVCVDDVRASGMHLRARCGRRGTARDMGIMPGHGLGIEAVGLCHLAASAGAWWSIVGPALMSVLLIRVSGVALWRRISARAGPNMPNIYAGPLHFFPAGRN